METPDENYCPNELDIENFNSLESIIYPNPCDNFFLYTSLDKQEIGLIDRKGRLLIKKIVEKEMNRIDCTFLNGGFTQIMIM